MPPVLIALEPVVANIGQAAVRLIKDDLTALDVDAFVFYAREDLELGSGYGTAIQQRGGPSIKKELEQIGSLEMGQAVITGAGQLRARHIIHACGPKFHEPDLESKLRRCMRSALRVAAENGLRTVAFPPMGAGFYGVPRALCADVMLGEIADFLRQESSLQEVIICTIDAAEFNAFKDKVAALR